mgnify:CR=1 FL=1
MTTKRMVVLCSACLVLGGLMGAMLFDMTQSTWERDESLFIHGSGFSDWYRTLCHRDLPFDVLQATAGAVTRDGLKLNSEYIRSLCPSESELIASLPNIRSKKQTNLILQDDGETVTQRVTLAEENEAAKPTDETLSQRVITLVEDSTPEPVAPEAVDDDYAPLRWTIKQDIPYISIYSGRQIDLGDWVDADLLETTQRRYSTYTWDTPVLFQVLRELRQMREACR